MSISRDFRDKFADLGITLVCITCNNEKLINKFPVDNRRPLGVTAVCLDCVNEQRRKVRTPDIVRNDNLWQQHGITTEDYNRMYVAQEGKCGICKKHFERMHVDHCHETNRIRELLCGNCNLGIGNLQDDAEIIQNALEYIKKWK